MLPIIGAGQALFYVKGIRGKEGGGIDQAGMAGQSKPLESSLFYVVERSPADMSATTYT